MEPPRPERSRSRAAWALLVSLLLHLAVAWWFARGRPPPAAPGHEQPPPIEVQVIQLPAPAPAPASPPAPVRVPKRSSPAQVAQGPAQPEHEPAAPGAPERIDLLPPPSLLPGPAGPGGSGRTITNRPQTSEEHAGAVAEEAGRVKDRVDGWLAADQGRHQVAMGLVDPYFGQVRG
ncbi:MAG TPA: hypothetical protein VND93_31620, partial [Myxococcales bacterium]|nr:hypothetical protein [Myxococcales bacterium]